MAVNYFSTPDYANDNIPRDPKIKEEFVLEEHLSRKLAVLLHADVVSSTTLVRINETLAHQRMQDAFRRFSDVIVQHRGIVHEIRGDALVAEFPMASDAVAAAVDFQNAHSESNQEIHDDIIPLVRIGIAMGEVVVADKTVTGEGIVLAQRLEQLAKPGGVYLQDAVYQTLPKRLPFEFENLGECQVKGFDEPVKVYAVRCEAEERPFATTAGTNTREPLRQTIRYTTSADGRNIAWSSSGKGPPLLLGWHHLSHLERDWASPLFAPWIQRLASIYHLVRFDIRGSGLSDSIGKEDTIEQHVDDMQAVADAAGLSKFPVIGILQNAAVAIKLAARIPDCVERLVLINGYARGRAVRQDAPEVPEHDPFITLLNSGGWGDPKNGFMRAWATMALPTASQDEITQFIELIANTGSTDDTLRQRALIDRLDVTAELSKVQCPTIVLHAHKCSIHPVEEGRRLAAGISGAEFVQFDSANSIGMVSDPTTEKQLATVIEFLARKIL